MTRRLLIAALLLVAVAAAVVPLAGQVVPRGAGSSPPAVALPRPAAEASPRPAVSTPAPVPAAPSLAFPGKESEKSPAGPIQAALPGGAAAAPAPANLPQTRDSAAAAKGASAAASSSLPAASNLGKSPPAGSKALPEKKATPSAGSSAAASGTRPASPSRRELVIEQALVMLIDDNRVPATETGMLTAIHVQEGSSVQKGALLAEIDSRATLAKQRIAQGELAAALAQAENDAEVEVARHAIEVAKADLDANTEIRRTNKAAVSEAEHRKFVFQYQRSLAQEKQAINEKEIARLTATAKQAQLDATTVELELRQIRAPFDGQVVEIMKNVGDWVTAGEPIMHVVGLKRVRVKGFVPASLASHEEVLGKPVTITVYSGGQREHTVHGTIGFASPVIEGVATSRQFRIWAEVENTQSIDPVTGQAWWKIQPGSVAKMVIDLTPSGRSAAATPPSPAASAAAPPGERTKVQSLRPVTDGPAAPPPGEKPAKAPATGSTAPASAGDSTPPPRLPRER